jgi:ATP-binding cassette subfamily F protein 3
MLSAHHINKSYGIQTVLQDITFSISTGERTGLIGPNGCGKSTLMRILVGLEQPDSGTVAHTRSDLRIGYLSQGFEFDPALTIAKACTPASARDLESDLARLATALTANSSDKGLQAEYDTVLGQLSVVHVSPEDILTPLGLAGLSPEHPVGELSGGQKTRLLLAQLLLSEPNLLLLDEPTNHLDIQMLEWLEDWLRRFRGAALIVSHDRAFLDNTVSSILELDQSTHGLKQYGGDYSAYSEQKMAEQEHQLEAYADWKAEIARLQKAAIRVRSVARNKPHNKTENDTWAPGFFANRTKETVKKAKHIEARVDRLLTEERVERPRTDWQMKLNFNAPQHLSRDVLVTENLSIGYPGQEPLLTGLRLQVLGGQRLALTGPNGCGKTTLLRTIAGKLEPVAGSVRLGASVKLGYMAQEQELLDPHKSPLEIIQEAGSFNPTRARTFLHAFLFSGDAPLRLCGEMSYGERARLELALLIARGCTFLLLDEPVNHLDIPSRARFEQALKSYEGTVLAVVHDRYFIERFATEVWTVEDGRVRSL